MRLNVHVSSDAIQAGPHCKVLRTDEEKEPLHTQIINAIALVQTDGEDVQVYLDFDDPTEAVWSGTIERELDRRYTVYDAEPGPVFAG